jgi:hypothetical protein
MITVNTTLTAFFMAISLPVAAQQPILVPEGWIMPRIPDEAEKKAALKTAYEMNGRSMVRNGSIDLTGMIGPKPIKTIPITPDPPQPVVDNDAQGGVWPKLEAHTANDICSRHKLHKVITGPGWRCRK